MTQSRIPFARKAPGLSVLAACVVAAALAASGSAQTPSAQAPPAAAPSSATPRPSVTEFQRLVDDYGREWTMTDGQIDPTKLDRFYAPEPGVVIFDFAPPGVSNSWAEHRAGLRRELLDKLKVNRYVPRQDVTLKLLGDGGAVTTFTFDYANEGKDGSRLRVTGRRSNVWERRGDRWLIVHEHGSPVPGPGN